MFVFSGLGPPFDLFIVHQRNSFSLLPLHQLPIPTPQYSLVCFWGFSFFMRAAGITCGGGVDKWWTVSDRHSSKRSLVKVKRSQKNPSASCWSPSLMMIWGLLHLFPGFWNTAYAMINCLLAVDTQCPTYTHLTRTSTLQRFVFSSFNPSRWTPAVCLYVFQSFVIAIQAEDSRTKNRELNSQTLECYTSPLLGYDLVSTLIITFRVMSPKKNHHWHSHPVPAWGFRSTVHLSYMTGRDVTSSPDVRGPDLHGGDSLCCAIGLFFWHHIDKWVNSSICNFCHFLFFTFRSFWQCWFVCILSKWEYFEWRKNKSFYPTCPSCGHGNPRWLLAMGALGNLTTVVLISLNGSIDNSYSASEEDLFEKKKINAIFIALLSSSVCWGKGSLMIFFNGNINEIQ